jgi:L-ascorbate 6-phosphate lactonase
LFWLGTFGFGLQSAVETKARELRGDCRISGSSESLIEVVYMSLMKEIERHNVAIGSLALWWLGQASFILKSPQGITVAIDPYLTNSCRDEAMQAGFDCNRRFPSPVQPEELAVNVIALTHSHQDHCDPETITRHRTSGFRGPYVAPGETMEKLLSFGVFANEVALSWPNKEHRFGDLCLKSTFAISPAGDDVTHTGYLAFIDSGPTTYFTGDTDYHDVLEYIAGYKPEVMVTVINGAFHNLGPMEATKLTQKINPNVVIPCHYDLFPDNSLDPRLFRACLHSAGISNKYLRLEYGKLFSYNRNSLWPSQ